MTKEDCKWVFEWNYLGWINPTKETNNYTQEDWNQTLNVIINRISVEIHKSCLRGGADTLTMHSNLLKLFLTFGFYNHFNDKLVIGQRFNLKIDDTLPENIVFITNQKRLIEHIFIPLFTRGETIVHENGDTETEMGEVTFRDGRLCTEEERRDYIATLKGCIEIKNYKPTI